MLCAILAFAVIVGAVGKPDMKIIDVLMSSCIVCHVIGDLLSRLGVGHTYLSVERLILEEASLAVKLSEELHRILGVVLFVDLCPAYSRIDAEGVGGEAVAV